MSEKFLIALDETAPKRLVEIEADLLTQNRQHQERKCVSLTSIIAIMRGSKADRKTPLSCSYSSHRIINMRGARPTLWPNTGA
jgi:hypothetical protein